MEDRFPSIECEHCKRLTSWPVWVRHEHCHYDALCAECFDRLCQEFTPENAVLAALIVVGIRQGMLNAQVQR